MVIFFPHLQEQNDPKNRDKRTKLLLNKVLSAIRNYVWNGLDFITSRGLAKGKQLRLANLYWWLHFVILKPNIFCVPIKHKLLQNSTHWILFSALFLVDIALIFYINWNVVMRHTEIKNYIGGDSELKLILQLDNGETN